MFHLIVAQSDIVGDIALVSGLVESLLELLPGFLIFLLLVEHTSLGYDCLCTIGRHLLDQGLSMSDFLELVLTSYLQLENFVCVILVFNLLSYLLGFIVHNIFVERLGMIELIGVYFWVELGELIVHICSVSIVLDVVVTIT